MVEAAIARDHDVSIFNRGVHRPDLFPSIPRLQGDRNGDLRVLTRGRWDAVVDTCGMLPQAVQRSAAILKDSVGLYAYLSSISAYRDLEGETNAEDAPLAPCDARLAEPVTPENYGALKAGCEATLQSTMPGRNLIIRPGLIAGPHDPTDRFTYWVRRLNRGGRVLAPGSPVRQVQVIDVRDLASWLIDIVAGGVTGVFNATGPRDTLLMYQLLEVCRGHTAAELVWVDDDFLDSHGVVPFSDLPLWLPEAKNAFLSIPSGRAQARGLSYRPLEETASDVLRWDLERGFPEPMKAGLSLSREDELLKKWTSRRDPSGATTGPGG